MWADLPEDVYFEITDPRYINRSHGKKATSSAGCNGPLCRKAARESKERQRESLAREMGQPIKRYKKTPERVALDELLNKILAWHWLVRSAPNPTEMVLDGIRERQQIA